MIKKHKITISRFILHQFFHNFFPHTKTHKAWINTQADKMNAKESPNTHLIGNLQLSFCQNVIFIA